MELFYKSKYFTFKELTRTDEPLNNLPSDFTTFVNLLALQFFLDSLREKIGKPIIVNSAFRSPAVNSAVNGAENSYHLQGLAADIRLSDNPNPYSLRAFIAQHFCPGAYLELKKYDTFVHVAINRDYWFPFVCNRFLLDLQSNKL